jgi:hypothetical protein
MSEEKSRRRTPYPAETRERAIRMVLDHQDEYPSAAPASDAVPRTSAPAPAAAPTPARERS